MINPAKFYTIDEYIEILRNRIWYIIIPFVLIVVGSTGYAIFAPRLYKASTLVLVSPQRIPEAFVQSTVTSKVEERLQSIGQEVLSRTRLEQIIREMKLYQKEQKNRPMEEVVELMQKDIKIELPTRREETKGFFTIAYIGRDPNVVATVANRLASQFIEENLKLREQQAVGTTQFLETEMTASKEKLDELEKAVSNYKRHYIGELPEQRDSNIKILEQQQNQYQRIGETLRAAKDRKLFLQKQLTDMEMFVSSPGAAGYEKESRPSSGKSSGLPKDSVSSTQAGERGVSYASQKETLARNLEDLRARYTENHPDVIIAKKKLADLEKKKDTTDAYNVKKDPRYKELSNQLELTNMEIARFSADERSIVSQINKYLARIEKSPAREQEMASLLREHQSMKETYERLLKKSQDAQQSENLEKRQKGEQFRIIDPARVPEKPFSPDILKIILIGLLAAIGGSFGLAFIREQMDRSFHDAGDVEITLGLNVLSTIPNIEEKES
jgi:polysaccharide chain length determinant protein (PEP-CTERM system associated)